MRAIGAQFLIGVLRVYRWTLSPVFTAIGVRCRHEPSCSAYGIDAVQRHGAWAGLWLGLARFLRCHPWGTHGYDPAPTTPRRAPWYAPWRLGDWRGPRGEGKTTDLCDNDHA